MMAIESGTKQEQKTKRSSSAQELDNKPDSHTIKRFFTKPNESPFDEINWELRSAKITDESGKIVFEQTNVLVPDSWSQLATTIVVSKYFRGHPGTPTRETSVAQVIKRVVDTITESGIQQGYFDNPGDAETFRSELAYVILHQMGTFNSPVWFNVGVVDKPQSSGCFILPVEDSMDSILKLAHTEAHIFKGGSGTGTNLSPLRGSKEHLSGGGIASGPISFMKGFDAFTSAVKSGGKNRRAAKMVILDIDHPDIMDFIWCKANEEKKAHALIDAGYDGSIDGEAYATVAFQNSNNSVRISDTFMRAVEQDDTWETTARTTGEVMSRHKAKDVLMEIARAAHQCGDPGVQFDTTINKYNTCKNSGRINATNACSELNFLDNTSCNLASINLLQFLSPTGVFDVPAFEHAVDVFITAQDILVDMSSYPTPGIEENSKKFRPLGIGYTNLGATLMAMGLPYDSDEGRKVAASITALMTGRAYARSARLAELLGPFEKYDANQEPLQDVINLHMESVSRQLLHDIPPYTTPLTDIVFSADKNWKEAKRLGKRFGFRNAQVSLLAPCGTISFMLDCDTTGVEPDFSLVKTKNLVGGGSVKTYNASVPRALKQLGYSDAESEEIVAYIRENGTVEGMPLLHDKHLPVFDCAAKPQNGTRYISPMGHVEMVGSVQPFLSGAVSKTINMPNSATPEDVFDMYTRAWKIGIKAMAIYREGSKRIQPLQTRDAKTSEPAAKPEPVARRKRLPEDRQSITHKFSIVGHEGYVTIGQYEDGTPGEMFIRMSKAGSVISGLMDGFALSISMALQYGVPLDVLVEKYTHTRFEPSGFTANKNIPMTTSILDYIFRWMASKYLKDENQMPEIEIPVQKRLTDIGYLGKSHDQDMDGPACPRCGAIMTTRTGTCYTCTACGTSGGCG